MLYRHEISTEFRGIFRVFVNFADLPEFRGSTTARNIRSPGLCMQAVCANIHQTGALHVQTVYKR